MFGSPYHLSPFSSSHLNSHMEPNHQLYHPMMCLFNHRSSSVHSASIRHAYFKVPRQAHHAADMADCSSASIPTAGSHGNHPQANRWCCMFGNLATNSGDAVFKNILVVHFCVDIHHPSSNNDTYLYKNWHKTSSSYQGGS